MAEYIKTTARSVVKLPEGIEPAAVAALADAGLTAYHAVVLDRNPDALALTQAWGADHTVLADGTHVDKVLELTMARAPRSCWTSSANRARSDMGGP